MSRAKLLLMVVWTTFLIGCATASQNNVTVLVTGIGSTVDEARHAAFRDAIQLANGSLNLSERRIVNDELFEDDVSYARGVIDSFQEVSRIIDPKDRQYRIQMSVTVSPTAIQKRLLAAQDSKTVSGNEILRQNDVAQEQIRSEIDRYMAARRLFEHIIRGMATTLFDVTIGQVETVRSEAKVSSFVDIGISINPKVLQSLCLAAKEYHITRTSGIPENFRKNISYLSILNGTDCRIEAEVEPSHMASIVQDFDNLGICLNLENGSGQSLQKIFYQPDSPQLINNRLRYIDANARLSYSGRYDPHVVSGAYLLRRYTHSNVKYPFALFLVRGWNNEEKFRLDLQKMTNPVLQGLSKITATLSNDEDCRGPKPNATTSLGLRLVGHPGAIFVEDVLPGSLAQRADFMVGDQILTIDDSSVAELTVQQVAARMTGSSRSFLRVKVFRKKMNLLVLFRISVP